MGFFSDLVKGSLSVASPTRVTVRTIQNPGKTLTHPYDTSGPLTLRSQVDNANVLGTAPPRTTPTNFQQPAGGVWSQFGGNQNQYFQNALIRALQGQGGQPGGQQPMGGVPNYANYVPPGGGQPPPSALPSSSNPTWQMGGQGQMNQLFQLGAAQPPQTPQPSGINPNSRMGNLTPLGGSYA